jgi:predicted dehydrogenase
MSTNQVRIALIGAGQIATEVHLPVLAKLRSAYVIGVYDVNEAKAQRVAEEFRLGKVYESFNEISKEKIDLVDICTPPQTHTALVIESLSRGISCIVEKPLAITADEVQQIINIQAKHSALVFPIQSYSFIPAFQKAKAIIAAGEIGKVVFADIRFNASFKDHRHRHFLDEDHWIHELPGDIYSDLLPHLTYLLVELVGPVDVVKVLSRNLTRSPNVLGDELIAITGSSNAIGSLSLSYGSALRLMTCFVVGTRGALRIDGNSQAVVKIGVIRDSSKVVPRATQSLSEILQLIQNMLATGSQVFAGHYTPVSYPHRYLFEKCFRTLLHHESYPVGLGSVRDSILLCNRITEELRRPE